MIFKDYYKILGFDTNKVSISEIKNSYRELAKKYHPDININDDGHSEEIFKDINEAYRTLSNEKSRRKYDFSWNKYIGKYRTKEKIDENKSVKNMFFSMLLGENIEREKDLPKIYGDDINTGIDIEIEQAFFGANKKLKIKLKDGQYRIVDLEIPSGIQNGEIIKLEGMRRKTEKMEEKMEI